MDKELIEQIILGSQESFTILYDRYVSLLYQFVYSIIKSDECTQDIVQETFVTIWVHRSSLQSNTSIKSYLFKIAYHRTIKELRRKVNHPLMKDYLEYSNTLLSNNPSAPQQLDFEKFLSALEEAKKKLTVRQRQIFEMNKEDGLRVSEIASKLSISAQSVSNQLSGTLRILRRELPYYLYLFLLFVKH